MGLKYWLDAVARMFITVLLVVAFGTILLAATGKLQCSLDKMDGPDRIVLVCIAR